MEKTLVVMRHGKAMAPEQGQPDKDRSLTEAGALALGARLPRMLRLLEAGDATLQIWSSPAKRACQTARLLEAALHEREIPLKKGIETHECLWEQDIDGFLNDLRASDADFICVVGHVPFAEDVVEELAGSTPPFSTGGLCCLRVKLAEADEQGSSSAADHARLLWFAQGPIAAHWDTFVQLQAALTKTAEIIEDRRTAFIATPEDIETIHRFRTNSRKERPFTIRKVALSRPREELYQRINARVDQMMADGLLDEVKSLIDKRHTNALNTVGYKELFDYLDGRWSLDEAVERIKGNTRRYARKQLTWYKRDESMRWFHPDNITEIKNYLSQYEKVH